MSALNTAREAKASEGPSLREITSMLDAVQRRRIVYPDFIPHEALKANTLPRAGEALDWPEEGDELRIGDAWYVYEGVWIHGTPFERWGWHLAEVSYPDEVRS